jgi:outer membrane receptor protein involved in Fe transport
MYNKPSYSTGLYGQVTVIPVMLDGRRVVEILVGGSLILAGSDAIAGASSGRMRLRRINGEYPGEDQRATGNDGEHGANH